MTRTLPVGLELPDGTLFSVDTETSVFELPVSGTDETVLAAVLSDSKGRRRIELREPDAPSVTVRDSSWGILAAGASRGDSLCVCWSELGGAPSTITEGGLPDPTEGLQLFCRFRTAGGWSSPFDLAPEASAAWIQRVEVDAEGYRVHYRRDSGWLLLDSSELDGNYSRVVAPGSTPGPSVRNQPPANDLTSGSPQ